MPWRSWLEVSQDQHLRRQAVRAALPPGKTYDETLAAFSTLLDGIEGRLGTVSAEAEAVEVLADALRDCGSADYADRAVAAWEKRSSQRGATPDPLWADPESPGSSRALALLAHAVSSASPVAETATPPASRPRRAESEVDVFGTWLATLDRLGDVTDPTTRSHHRDGAVELRDRRGRVVAEVEAGIVGGLDADMVAGLHQALLREGFGVDGQRLLRFVIHRIRRQVEQAKLGSFLGVSPRDVHVPGGWKALAAELGGTNRSRLKRAARILQGVRLRGPGVEIGGLISYLDRGGAWRGTRELLISGGPTLDPRYRPADDRRVVPVPEPGREPPLHGRGQTHAAQLRMQQLWLLEARRRWRDLLDHRAVLLREPEAFWCGLASRSGLPRTSTMRVVRHWEVGDDRSPPFLRVEGELWSLARHFEPEMEFLLQGARASATGPG